MCVCVCVCVCVYIYTYIYVCVCLDLYSIMYVLYRTGHCRTIRMPVESRLGPKRGFAITRGKLLTLK